MKELITINKKNSHLILQFLKLAGASLSSFRYFDKRDLLVLKNHIITYLLLEDGIPIGYGHLDKENDLVWLGVALVEGKTGQGNGRYIIENLVHKARQESVSILNLTVDEYNLAAINLYKKFGFSQYHKSQSTLYFMLSL